MTVVGIHPEELFDKLFEGALSPAESERLEQHLRACDVCRFEYAARLDFREEARPLSSSPPPVLSLRPLALPSAERGPAAVRVAAPRRRGRRRLLMLGVAAAALITASAAVAASVAGRGSWRTLSTLFAPPVPVQARAVPASKPLASPASAPMTPLAEPGPSVTAPPLADAAKVPRVTPPRSGTSIATPRSLETSETPPRVLVEAKALEPSSAAKLFGDANQARRSGDVGRASGLYRLLQEQYPSSPEAELSRVTLALLQLDSGDAPAALIGFERYLAGSSRGLEAEALVGRARALGRLGRRDLEVSAWREVQRKYPRSIYGRQATERLSALGQP